MEHPPHRRRARPHPAKSTASTLAAASVLDHVHSPFEQRGGRVRNRPADPRRSCAIPTSPGGSPPASRTDRRPQLDLAAFVQSTDTLYLHSKEGQGSSAGLVTALAMALCDAAEQHAKHSPGGRLAVPLVGVLDEAANICRWRQLPDLYSHYGSRGICLLTLLQSWSQGVQVWGPTGMRKLWGVRQHPRLRRRGRRTRLPLKPREADRRIQPRRRQPQPAARRHTGTSASTSWQLTPTPILTVAELAALPRDRADRPAIRRAGDPRPTDPLVEHEVRPTRSGRRSTATTPPPPAQPPAQGEPMDHDHLTGEADDAGALPGSRAARRSAPSSKALKQHAAGVTAAAVARRPRRAGPRLDRRARRRARARSTSPSPPARTTRPCPSGSSNGCCPSTAARSAATTACGVREWWRHDEAVARLDALWRAWEHLRLDPATGLSVWFRDHADHHMTILLDADGPFKGCDGTHSQRPLEPLPPRPPPPGDVRTRRRPHPNRAR